MSYAECKFQGCPRPALTKGLCNGHYLQQWRGSDLTPLQDAETLLTR